MIIKLFFLCFLQINCSEPINKKQSESKSIDDRLVINNLITETSYNFTVYIDPQNINDPNENGSINNPFNSWTDIIWRKGTQYLLKKGTTIAIDGIEISKSDVLIGSYGQGKSPIIKSLSKFPIIKVIRKRNILIQNIDIIAPNAEISIEFIGNSDNIIIENCNFRDSNYGIKIQKGNNYLIRYNTFECKKTAVYSKAQNNVISYNIFKNNDRGISIIEEKSSAQIFNNVFFGNHEAIYSDFSNLKLYNNIFYLKDPDDKAIIYKKDKLISDNNIFYPDQNGFVNINNRSYDNLKEFNKIESKDKNSIASDPLFIDINSDNFALKGESPAISAGKSVGIIEDFYGMEIPFGRAPAIGITELNANEIKTITNINPQKIADSLNTLTNVKKYQKISDSLSTSTYATTFQKITDSMNMSTVVFNTPTSMYIGEIKELVLKISCEHSENQLKEQVYSFFKDSSKVGEIVVDQIPTSFTIDAILDGFGFEIRARTPLTQEVRTGIVNEWIWNIKATEPNMQLLTLMINSNGFGTEYGVQKTIRSFRQEVFVRVDRKTLISEFIINKIEWLVSGLIAILAFLYGRYNRRKKESKRKD